MTRFAQGWKHTANEVKILAIFIVLINFYGNFKNALLNETARGVNNAYGVSIFFILQNTR